jgi:hypothetical protein
MRRLVLVSKIFPSLSGSLALASGSARGRNTSPCEESRSSALSSYPTASTHLLALSKVAGSLAVRHRLLALVGDVQIVYAGKEKHCGAHTLRQPPHPSNETILAALQAPPDKIQHGRGDLRNNIDRR